MSSLIDRSSTAVVCCSLIVIDSKPGERGVCPRVSPGFPPGFPGFPPRVSRVSPPGFPGFQRLGRELPNEAIFPRNANKLNPLVPLDTNRIAQPLPASRSMTAPPEFRMAHRGGDPAAAGVAIGV